MISAVDSWMHLCCTEDPTRRSNFTMGEDLQPLQNGDVTIMYDVIRSYDTNYWTQITVSNHNPLHQLENWKLSWEWKRDEFIYAMKGAYPSLIDTADCIFGKQGEHYKEIDFSNTLNCERMPTIIDLPPTMANNSDLGMIPFCCRNGTILSPAMDESKSVSVFQMQVFKMPAEFNRTELIPPQNWKIRGAVNQDYQCAPPVRVSRSRFPDRTGLSSDSTAIASWQVVCNKTESKGANPRCCVSFSSFLNDSIVPCKTCACGCKISPSSTCSASAPALLLPSEALLVPFENRTQKATEFAKLHQLPLPKPLPCGDNCGVSINWHLHTDYENGWTARITLFNWDETDIVDWFAALQFEKAVPGFQTMYSFNGSALPGLPAQNTIFMQGKPGLNYLLAEKDGKNPKKNPRVPGTQQSVIIFTKKTTPGIKVAGRDGFPTKVFFNGEECSLPSILPSNAYRMSEAARFFGFFLTVAVLLCLQH